MNAASSIALVSLLLPAGAMGDKFGSKQMMTLGLVTLGTCGGLSGMHSISSLQLICIRAGMGLAAALILPNSLSVLLRSTELDGHDKAIADWTLAVNTGQPIGMAIPFFIIGMRLQWLTHVHWWQQALLLNLPWTFLTAVGAACVARETRRALDRSLDVVGIVLCAAASGLLVYCVIQEPETGLLSPQTLLTGSCAVVLGCSFAAWETPYAWAPYTWASEPMLPLHVLRDPAVTASAVLAALGQLAYGSFAYSAMLFLQLVQGRTVLAVAFAMLPQIVGTAIGNRVSLAVVERCSAVAAVRLGWGVTALGLALLIPLQADSPYSSLVWSFVAIGMGMGISGASPTSVVLASAGI